MSAHAILASLTALTLSVTAVAQDPAAQPGQQHEKLMKYAGEYTTVTQFTLKPGDPLQETKGTAKLTRQMGGRFLQEEGTGTMMGQPYTSFHLTGYNNVTGNYESNWAYTGSSGQMLMIGTSKDDGKTIEFVGSYEPQKGVKGNLYAITRFQDPDHFTTELYAEKPETNKGPVMKTMYTRKK